VALAYKKCHTAVTKPFFHGYHSPGL